MVKRLLYYINVMVLLFTLCSCGAENINIINEEIKTLKESVYVGSVNSDVFHYPDCKWAGKIKFDNEVWFESIEDAVQTGYRSCRICHP